MLNAIRRLHGNIRPSCYTRLADKTHRHLYKTLDTEARRYKKNNGFVTLKPTISHYLVYLQKIRDHQASSVGLGRRAGVPTSFQRQTIIEFALFHLLIAISPGPGHDFKTQYTHLQELMSRHQLQPKADSLDLRELLSSLSINIPPSSPQEKVALTSLSIIYSAYPSSTTLTNSEIVRWIHCIQAPSISEACTNLSGTVNVPACVATDVLLRTPMSKHELSLQLGVWSSYLELIAKTYYKKKSHLAKVFNNLVYYCIQYSPADLRPFILTSLDFFTSKKSGYTFKFMDNAFLCSFLWNSSMNLLQLAAYSHYSNMCVIQAQEVVVRHLTGANISHEGYMGLVISLKTVSQKKALNLFKHAADIFPEEENTLFHHIASIYLSQTPEQILHSFDVAAADYSLSALLWFIFVKMLQETELLNTDRALKLLDELTRRKDSVILSKLLLLLILNHLGSISALETAIAKLDRAKLLKHFTNIVHIRYLNMLYSNTNTTIPDLTSKPYLKKLVPGRSNLERARHLYALIERKSVGIVGTMLNGEAYHQPERLYDFYQEALGSRTPDEHCLCALLRVVKRNQQLMWGEMFASQIAVHEFKASVHHSSVSSSVVPSDKTWCLYIEVLSRCDYTAELAELLRWWEELKFTPSRSTLELLLKALPVPYAERHVKHWSSLPEGTSFVHTWPWPSLEEFKELK